MTPVLHPGVGSLNDRVVGDDYLDGSETPQRSYVSNFIKIGHQEPCQDDPRPPSWSWILGGVGNEVISFSGALNQISFKSNKYYSRYSRFILGGDKNFHV